VSVPVSWRELEAGLDPLAFGIRSVPLRLERLETDPWDGYDAGRRDLDRSLFTALGIEEQTEG
jgi:DNA primase